MLHYRREQIFARNSVSTSGEGTHYPSYDIILYYSLIVLVVTLLLFQVDIIEERLNAVEELIKRPEILTNIQTTLGRFCDLDQLLSLCVILPKQETIHTVEQRINQVIGLKHGLSLVPSLQTQLAADITSEILIKIKTTLDNPNYPAMLEKVNRIICEDAK